MATKTKTCPSCGGAAVEIAYGYPDMELVEQADHGEVVLGGCVMDFDSPLWQCRDCGYDWGR